MARLSPSTAPGRAWAHIVNSGRPYLRDLDQDPFKLWQLDPWLLPGSSVDGPLVYVVLGHQRVQYVGQTRRSLQQRLREHLHEESKGQDWSHVGAMALVSRTPKGVLDALEVRASLALRPLMGSKWPAPRVGTIGGARSRARSLTQSRAVSTADRGE